MQETQDKLVQSLGHKDPLEEEMATHSSIFAWSIPWTEEPGGLQSIGLQRVRHDWSNWTCTYTPMYLYSLIRKKMSQPTLDLNNKLLLLLSHFSHVQLCVTPQMATHQAPLSLGFSRQEHWSGLPLPSPLNNKMVSMFFLKYLAVKVVIIFNKNISNIITHHLQYYLT